MTLNTPILTKTFVALRTDFYPGFDAEHITLRYYQRVRWDDLLTDCARFDRLLPASIEPIVYSSWKSWEGGPSHSGLLVQCKGSMILDYLTMPHITLPNKLMGMNSTPIRLLEPQVVDGIWIGKKIDEKLTWIKYNNKDIGINYEQLSTLPTVEEYLPPYYEPTSLAGG